MIIEEATKRLGDVKNVISNLTFKYLFLHNPILLCPCLGNRGNGSIILTLFIVPIHVFHNLIDIL